ncbi:hypothetical protein HRG_000523 [Hirsutella rhossiliensis]|uniref:Rhodopsin domain-containing protein n=1 Tax=Hirsutella rhossiliensis TaxID=111463 RepID=A0A9P8SP63_9HYPO|nr:uncharacterized protein HRG_00523 [Hirsutella rhossiliensis]KAH0967881.1 hypothetical protein HRG_00523 [Hirsutella rhossiliensis]
MSSSAPVDRGPALEAAIWTQIVIAFVFVVLRFWARFYPRGIGLDDGLMLTSWVLFLASGVIIQLGAQDGMTLHFQDLSIETQQYQLQLVVIFLAIAIATTWLGKVAIGITILRIIGNTSPWKRYAILVLLGLMTLFSVTDIFLSLFRCGNPRAQWDYELAATATCLPRSKTNPFNDGTNAILVFADYFLSVLPMAVIWGLRMPLRRRIMVIVLLGLTIITGVAGTVKMVHVSLLDMNDITGGIYDSLIWYGIETMFIIVFGSMPALHPLWRRFFQLLGNRRHQELNRQPTMT